MGRTLHDLIKCHTHSQHTGKPPLWITLDSLPAALEIDGNPPNLVEACQ
jgi:hypothetical protein